jgi:hypothetical protein
VIVSAAMGPSLPMIGGCGLAWRQDGSMTYIRRGLGRFETRLDWPARFAVLASSRSRTVLAVFSGRRIVALKAGVPANVFELRASPRGSYVVLGSPNGARVYDARRRDLPRVHSFGAALSVAWSADER